MSLEIRDLRAESRAESDQEKVLSRKLGLTWAKTKYFSRTENIFQQNSVKNLKEFGLTGPWILIFELVGRRMIDVFCKLVINNRFFKMKFKTFLNEEGLNEV